MNMPITVVVVPEIPAYDSDPELVAAIELLMNASFMSFKKDMLGEDFTGTYVATLKDRKDFMPHINTCAEAKQHYSDNGKKFPICTTSWYDLLEEDPELVAEHIPEMKGKDKSVFMKGEVCWHCAKIGPTMRCSACQKARYCSAECQKSARWHHAKTGTAEFRCQKDE